MVNQLIPDIQDEHGVGNGYSALQDLVEEPLYGDALTPWVRVGISHGDLHSVDAVVGTERPEGPNGHLVGHQSPLEVFG
jgi:hypothetical protein